MLAFFMHQGIQAQDRGNCREIKKKEAKSLYTQAISIMQASPKDASDLLLRAIAIEPKYVDAYYVLGDINYQYAIKWSNNPDETKQTENYTRTSLIYFTNVIELCPSFNSFLAYFYVGETQYRLKSYEKAKENLQLFQKNNKNDFSHLDLSKQLIKNVEEYFFMKNNPVLFEPKILEGICTESDEYLPLITPDGETIFYTHRYKKTGQNEEFSEEFAFSRRLNPVDSLLEIYENGKPMPAPFNDGRNQGGATITIDNKHLYITICELERANYTSYKNCDIFTTDFEGGKWSPLKRLGPNINNVNTFEGQPTITADGKELYFASAREGGYGSLDIYKSVKDKNNEWSKATNLGPIINTAGNDKTPFIHSDSRTLYFASDGRFGMGGFDIFYSQNVDSDKWANPKNMGYPINTASDEVGFIVSTNGRKLYFSSTTIKGKGGWDIFSSPLYKEAQPSQVLFVKGKILDDSGAVVQDARVELKNVQTKITTEGFVDDRTGNYAVAVAVNPNEDFILTTKKDGYFYNSQYINTSDNKFDPPTTVNIEVKHIKPDLPIRMNNVNFATNSSQLTEISKSIIEDLISFLNDNPNITIEVAGHTDNIGGTKFNLELSNRRAKAVTDYIITKGISTKRISYKGYGTNVPLSTNDNEAGRAMNRRVEFIVKKVNP